jgi:hypothetical protein
VRRVRVLAHVPLGLDPCGAGAGRWRWTSSQTGDRYVSRRAPPPPTNPLSAHVLIHAPRPKRAGAYCQLFFKDRAQYLES